MVTGIVDHTRDEDGTVHARPPDLVPGRSGQAYADWLKDRGAGFTCGIRTAALDPFAATPTRSATNCSKPSPFWMPSTS